METKAKKRPKGTRQVRQEKRGGKMAWGYHVWIRQPDGSRTQLRDFSFATKTEAQQALAALRTAGWKERYGINPPAKEIPTTVKEAVAGYQDLAEAKLITHRTEDTHLLERSPWSPTHTESLCHMGRGRAPHNSRD